MAVTGIIAELNPLHKGHEYLFKEAGRSGPVICALSGNFVQRGDTAIAEKRIRATAALKCGADLVVELPVLWSMSTAQNFALGGVSVLKYAGCDKIMFGSECGDISKLTAAADILSSSDFRENLSRSLNGGVTFAKARQSAAEKCGLDGEILSGANNNLAIEYISAAKLMGFDISFETIARRGAAHDSLQEAEFVSASLLREKLRRNNYAFCEKYMPSASLELLEPDCISDISRIEGAILGVLRTKTREQLSSLPDLSEGLENKLYSALRLAGSLEELYSTLKTKRYTLARIRRLVLSAFLGADADFFMKPVPYLRVLGFNKTGERLLKSHLSNSPVPFITKVSDFSNCSTAVKKVFEVENTATDLFALSLPTPAECGLEYTSKLIKLA